MRCLLSKAGTQLKIEEMFRLCGILVLRRNMYVFTLRYMRLTRNHSYFIPLTN